MLLLLASLLLAAASGCAESDTAKVERAEKNLRELIKQSKFAEIYRQASSVLKSSEKEEEFVANLREISQKTGEIVTVEKVDVHEFVSQKSPTAPPSTIYIMHLLKGKSSSCYEGKLWVIEGGEARLLAYDCLFTVKN
ncbi:MAG TPA: hypothetical protein VJ715_03520 [Pyrinomonadaceae bacterium]|nr:hypothetical protein [Pyrinomonadaceae bacterium]